MTAKILADKAGADLNIDMNLALGQLARALTRSINLCAEDAANLQTIADATASATPGNVNAFSPSALLTITPVLSTTPAYSAGDVLFAVTGIGGFSRAADIAAMLVSLAVIDKSDQKPQFTIDFYSFNVTSGGAANAVPAISDADAAFYMGSVPIVTADWRDRGGVSMANPSTKNLIMQPASASATVYMIGYLDAGTPTFALGDLVLRFGVAQ